MKIWIQYYVQSLRCRDLPSVVDETKTDQKDRREMLVGWYDKMLEAFVSGSEDGFLEIWKLLEGEAKILISQ